jgi:anti-sigma factor RsiW
LQKAISEGATYFAAPEHLRARIRAALPASVERKLAPRKLPWTWVNFGAAMAFAVVMTWGLTQRLAGPSDIDRLPEEVISSHIRSLMASHVADVASSDQHTVKPWFTGKLDFSPPVTDFTVQGFPLVGGRLDYLNSRPVAALVYRHNQHLINVFIWPTMNGKDTAAETLSRQGFNLVRWTHSGMMFWAISDLNPAELSQLASLLIAQAKPVG